MTPAEARAEADKAWKEYQQALQRQNQVTQEVEEASERFGERADHDSPIITPAMRAKLNKAAEEVERAKNRAFVTKLAANMAGIIIPAQ